MKIYVFLILFIASSCSQKERPKESTAPVVEQSGSSFMVTSGEPQTIVSVEEAEEILKKNVTLKSSTIPVSFVFLNTEIDLDLTKQIRAEISLAFKNERYGFAALSTELVDVQAAIDPRNFLSTLNDAPYGRRDSVVIILTKLGQGVLGLTKQLRAAPQDKQSIVILDIDRIQNASSAIAHVFAHTVGFPHSTISIYLPFAGDYKVINAANDTGDGGKPLRTCWKKDIPYLVRKASFKEDVIVDDNGVEWDPGNHLMNYRLSRNEVSLFGLNNTGYATAANNLINCYTQQNKPVAENICEGIGKLKGYIDGTPMCVVEEESEGSTEEIKLNGIEYLIKRDAKKSFISAWEK